MAGYRPEYSKQEDTRIIRFIIDHNGQHNLRGNVFWKSMEVSEEFDRTWQSLKERFRKKIFPNLHLYDLPQKEYEELREGYLMTEMHRQQKKVTGKANEFFI